MDARFPNTIQSCLLFEKRGFFDRRKKLNLEELATAYMKIQAAKSGHRYNVVEHVKGKVIQFYGGEQLMIRLELIDGPANAAVFQQAMMSPFIKIGFADAADVISKHGTHLLINIRHGVLPDDPKINEMLASIDFPKEGHSLGQFKQRLDVCAMLTSLAHDLGEASLVHWTQSNMLLKPKGFEGNMEDDFPHVIHVHPLIFQDGTAPDGSINVALQTFGAQHFIGREIHIAANPIPWADNYQAALAFIKVAIMKNGYVINDGDNFGVEGNDFSYRVTHIPAQSNGETETPARYDLELRYSKSHNYQSPNHTPDGVAIDLSNPPPEIVNTASPDGKDMLDLWEQKRKRAEMAGIEFRVTAQPVQNSGSPDQRPVFGKRH
jgi:hypothetical protein